MASLGNEPIELGDVHAILDFDGTLIHTIPRGVEPRAPYKTFELPKYRKLKCALRPGVSLSIEDLFAKCASVSVWSANTPSYVNDVIGQIMTPEQANSLAYVFTRNECGDHPTDSESYVKDLRVFWRKHPHAHRGNTVLIDDSPEVAIYQPWNYIQVPRFDALLPRCETDPTGYNFKGLVEAWVRRQNAGDVPSELSGLSSSASGAAADTSDSEIDD